MNPSDSNTLIAEPAQNTDLLEAIQELERAEQAPPTQVQAEISQAEKQVVKVRDQYIAWLRAHPADGQAQARKIILGQINQSLSLIVGVEYPSNFIRREIITRARDILVKLTTR
jgi:hypothetical protein